MLIKNIDKFDKVSDIIYAGGHGNISMEFVIPLHGLFRIGEQRADDPAFRVKCVRRVTFCMGYSEKCHPREFAMRGAKFAIGGA